MKSTVLKFGTYSSILLIVLFGISFFFEGAMSYETSEIFGYATIVLSLSFVYFGIRNYRDAINNGTVSFGKALKIGVLITLLAALTFGLINVVYTEVINPEFMGEYYNHNIEKYRASLPAAEFEAKLKEMESQKDMFTNPVFNFALMSITVFIIGFIISLLSALTLQRK